jgi:hypothetical protein
LKQYEEKININNTDFDEDDENALNISSDSLSLNDENNEEPTENSAGNMYIKDSSITHT